MTTPSPNDEPNGRGNHVENAEHVGHADTVAVSKDTGSAATVNSAEHVGIVEKLVEIHGEPIRTNAVRRLRYMRELAMWITTLSSLVVMMYVIIDKNNSEESLKHQLSSVSSARTASDEETSKKLECTRRYQDVVDAATENQLITIGDLIVAITQIPPGPDRESAVQVYITNLAAVNISARKAVKEKIDYNNIGNPLPCPLSPTQPPP